MQNVQVTGAAGGTDPRAREVALAVAADFADWLERGRNEIDRELSTHLKELGAMIGLHSRLSAAVQYSVRLGGKRLRPILLLECCRVCGGSAHAALPAALAMEFIHTFSLVHDDLPAMDDDDLRRGQPTNHKVYGEGMAVLAGDWLLAQAFALIASDRLPRGAVPVLAQALADGTMRMIEGQAADLDGEEQPTEAELVRFIHLHKTAALMETCCRIGAICAGASGDAIAALERYGQHLGLAFQIMDDVLDATSTREQMGKAVQKDATAAKQTFLAVYGLEQSLHLAEQEAETARHRLDSFGSRADRLRDLTRYVVRRDR